LIFFAGLARVKKRFRKLHLLGLAMYWRESVYSMDDFLVEWAT
jgi:hypothetical protein